MGVSIKKLNINSYLHDQMAVVIEKGLEVLEYEDGSVIGEAFKQLMDGNLIIEK